ncbi:MAG TPA: hypothetical protein VFB76_00080 [Candidatus Angelobacter sp.]|nr:hypothetical protein [Candidatus Angelobacter sp.]
MELCLITLAGMAHALAKILVCAIGAVALYCALFLYEDQERRIQNRIEQLWIEIDEKRLTGNPFALATKSAGVIGRGLDKVLGAGILSLRVVGMSVCMSTVTVCLVLVTGMLIDPGSRNRVMVPLMSLSLGLATVVGVIVRPQSRPRDIFLFVPASYFFAFVLRPVGWLLPLIILLSIGSDILFLCVLRISLRQLVLASKALWIWAAILVQITFLVVIGFAPVYWGNVRHSAVAENFGFGLAGLNLSTILLSVSFVTLLVFLCVHRVIHKYLWPILARLFYPIARYRIIINRKAMAGISIACFAVVSPPFAELLKKALEWFK